jgi:hypothetical protein
MARPVSFGQFLGYAQECWRDGWRRFLPARFSAFVVLVAAAIYLLMPMGADFIVAAATADDWRVKVIFVLTAFWWALNAWYWARIAAFLPPGDPPPASRHEVEGWPRQEARLRWFTVFWPRALGVAAILVVLTALLRACIGAPWDIVRQVGWLALVIALIAIPFFWLVFRRHDAIAWISRRFGTNAPALRPQRGPRPLGAVLRDPWILWPAGIMMTMQAVLLVLSVVRPIQTGQWLGPNAVILLATAGWTCGLGVIGLIGDRMRIAVLTTLLLVGAAVSYTGNENHAIRLLASEPPRLRTLDDAYTAWKQQAGPDAPMVLVASAGGASRAAYWTATVLGRLADDAPLDFRRHLFSMSGVSGGGLGLSVFAALLAEFPGQTNCGDPAVENHTDGFTPCGQAVLRRDFLSPLLMAALYRDGMQRFIPFVSVFESRATALEQAWEQAWRVYGASAGSTGEGRFAAPMGQLAGRAGWQPVLMINGTSTRTGRRIITTDLDLEQRRDGDFAAAAGFFGLTADPASGRLRDLRLSTAAHNGARFPFFSPGGLIEARGPGVAAAYVLDEEKEGAGKFRDRIVDGGYFENFGAASTQDLIDALVQGPARVGLPRLVVVQVSADPELFDDSHVDACGGNAAWPAPGWSSERRPVPAEIGEMLYEVTTPVFALSASRSGRGVEAMRRLRARVEGLGGTFVHFRLTWRGRGVDPPLNWVLSDDARARIDQHWLPEHWDDGGVVPNDLTGANCFNALEYRRLRAALAPR